MNVLALVSGGKDSCYNMLLCQRHGHHIIALGNLLPAAAGVDELDSYMFQTVGHNIIPLYAQCMGLPLYRRHISGSSVHQGLSYRKTEGDEVEDMLQLIAHVQRHHPQLQAVSSGAIASDYQRLRVEHVCARLGLVSLAYMWHQPQAPLLRGMIAAGIEAVLIKVAALGLVPERHLGKTLQHMEPHLHKICRLYGCNICGEGGEYETLVLDCPLFTHARIVLDSWAVQHLSAGDVAILHPTDFHLEPKSPPQALQGTPQGELMDGPDWNRSSTAAPGNAVQSNGAACTDKSEPPHAGLHPEAASTAAQCGGEVAGGLSGPASGCPPARAQVYMVPSQSNHSLASPDAQEQSSSTADTGKSQSVEGFQAHAAFIRSSHALSVSCAPQAAGVVAHVPASDLAEAAVHAALAEIGQGLQQHGVVLAEAVFVHLYLADMGTFAAVNRAYHRHFPAVSPAARACIQVPLPQGVPVAVDVLFRPGAARQVVHVQSISSWAPSCIGPYAQAVSAGGLTHFAGQIGLDPPTMSLVPGGPEPQAARCLRSCHAVSVAAKADLQHAQLGCTVYAAAEDSAERHGDSDERSADMEPAAGIPAVTQTFSQVQRIFAAYQGEGLSDCTALGKQHVSHIHCCSSSDDPRQTQQQDRRTRELPHYMSQSAMLEQDDENSEDGEDFVDAYLRQTEAPARIPAALLTYVEAAALPKSAAVELQPLALHSTWQGEADLQHITETFPASREHDSDGLHCMIGASLEAVVSPGRLCYAQLSLGQDEGEVSSCMVAQGMASALGRAQLSPESIESVRVYYNVTRLHRGRAVDLVQHALEELQLPWAPVMVPVLAVGMTPAADAALHLVWLGMKTILE